jgi:hypothetical protein
MINGSENSGWLTRQKLAMPPAASGLSNANPSTLSPTLIAR